jgi:hypothetical protein
MKVIFENKGSHHSQEKLGIGYGDPGWNLRTEKGHWVKTMESK